MRSFVRDSILFLSGSEGPRGELGVMSHNFYFTTLFTSRRNYSAFLWVFPQFGYTTVIERLSPMNILCAVGNALSYAIAAPSIACAYEAWPSFLSAWLSD